MSDFDAGLHPGEEGAESVPAELIISLLDSLAQCIYVLDRTGRFIYVNSAFVRYTATPRHILLRKNIHEIKHTFKPCVSEKVLETKGEVIMFQDIINAAQKTFRQLVTATPVFDTQGEVSYIVVTISAIETIERKLQTARNNEISKLTSTPAAAADHPKDRMVVNASPQMRDVLTQARQAASTDATCLLTGESGTGKEVVARYIHDHSPRAGGPFVVVNCASIPENLMESELFGYEPGTFTGGQRGGKTGSVEAAEGGTLFLDEINSLPLALQGKLLRVLETKSVKRLGGSQEKTVDFRAVAATNQDLYTMCLNKEFRTDLYYRLNLMPICIPPLRERVKDIIPLANFFLQKYCTKYGKNRVFSPLCCRQLLEYRWPGNVRELRNCVERILITTVGDSLEITSLPEHILRGNQAGAAGGPARRRRAVYLY